MDLRTSDFCFVKSKSEIVAFPIWIGRRVVSMLIVVVFPAPLGPRKEKISPFFTSKLMLSTAFNSPYLC